MATPRDYRPLHPGMGAAVAERTYLRKKENGDWETWGDVADRVALGNSLLCKDKRDQKKEEEILRRHIANASLLLSGRHLQHGDENQPKRNLEIYTNCSTSASSFVLFYLLLNGSGVGRCYDDDMMLVNWDYAPSVRCVIDHDHPDFDWSAHESLRDAKHKYGSGRDVMWFEVPDSREGWAKALEIWENSAFEKIHASKLLILDFSKVRAKGSPIGGMQNRPSSGPVPLMNAFHKAATLKGAGLERWRQALYIDHYFAECVLVGGARRCLPEGTVVTLKTGAKKIEDIVVGDSVVTPKGEKEITAVFDQGIQQTVLIRHAFGEFECTPNHRVAVFNSLYNWEFKQAQDVKAGDRLVFDPAGWDYNKETPLPKHNLSESNTSRFNTTGTPLIIPELDSGIAWLVGLIQGDGYVEKTKDNHGRIRIGVHIDDLLVAEKAAKELDRFGGTTFIKPVKGENRWEVICHGVQLADYFLMHVKRPNVPLMVPEFILHGTREIRWAFLAGLFDADGSSKTRPVNMVVTVYPEFAKQIQFLLLSLGVLSHSRVIVPKEQNWKPKTYINIKSMENINLVRTEMRESVTFSYDVKHSSGGFSFITESIRTEASINTAIAPNKTVPISRISNKTDIHFDVYPVPVHDVIPSGRVVQTYDIEVDDIHQFTANGFVVHNSARMSTKSWRDTTVLDFITVKRPIEYDGLNMDEIVELRADNPFPPTGFLWSSNNSVTADAEFWKLVNLKRNEKGFHDEITQHARRVMRKLAESSYADGTGEPGIINVDKLVQKEEGWEVLTAGDYVGSEKYKLEEDTELYMSRLARKAKRKKYCMITNPCLTSDTQVYVADGRTSVSIGELANEGKDVPVFCMDNKGEVTVRTMRNPRVTGYGKKILKVTLDNGQSLRVTENHKFLLRGKEEYVRADALQPGDSLFVVNRYEPDNSSESRGHQYVCIGHSANSLQWEHVEIASFHHASGNSLKGQHAHHLNENKSDNQPENLEIRIGTEHLSEHSMESDNPNYSGYTHDQILEFATLATKENGRRLSFKEWQAIAKEFGYPQTFSKWRDSHFNGVMGMLAQATMNAGLDPVVSRMDLDPRVIRSYQKMVSQGYDAEILDNSVVLNKNCECCGTPMKVNFLTPEVGLCSQSCKNKMRENNDAKHMQNKETQTKALENRKKVLEERKSNTREQQVIVYNDIKFTLRREPTRAEFQSACKEKGVKPEIGRKTSPFPKWPELKEAAANHNHKVISVEEDGYEDVYNGTVDEFHNFFVGGFEEITRNGRPKLVWVNNQNCGEIALTILGGYCTIADVVPFHADTLDDAEEAFRTAVRALIRVNTMDCLYNKEVKRTNRIGVGMTGVMEFAWRFFGYGFRDLIDEEKSKDFWLTLARFNQAVYDEAVSYSKKLGVTVPHTMTTIKPSGTVSKLFGLCEGWHLPSMKWYVRWVQFREDDPLIAKYRAAGYPVRELKQYRGHLIVGFPTQPIISSVMPEDKLVTAGEATPEEQYKWLMLGEKYWIHGTDTDGNPVTDRNIGNQISYCLAGDKNHLIPTTDGLQRIEDIKCSNTNDRFGLSQQIVDLVDNGIKKTMKAKLQNGVEIIGTKEHRLLTIDENLDLAWKTLGSLEAGDVIIRRVGDNQWSKTNVKLPGLGDLRIDGRMGNTNKVTVPIEVTPQFALFSGMLLSDGHVSINSIGITTVDHDVAELFSDLLWNLFGLVSHTKFDSRTENVMRVEAHSRAISRWLKEIFPSASDHSMNFIPACILQSRRECVEQFTKGYTLDGYVSSASGWAHICTTVSETMAKDLASVLFNLGFDAYIGHKAGRPYHFSEKNNGIGKDQYVVYLSRNDSLKFIEEIGFVETRKNNAMSVFDEATMPHKSNAIPAMALMEHYQSNRDDYHGNENLRGIMKAGSSSISMQTVRREFSDLDIVKPIMDPNMRFTRVISVEDSGERHTYDITVDVSHEYVANSVVVHNTLKYLPEDVDYKGFKDMLVKYQSQIRCCSVMPQGDTSAYEYQPEQPVNKAEYEKIAHAIQMALEEDIGKEHVDCDSGSCPIDFRSDADVKAA